MAKVLFLLVQLVIFPWLIGVLWSEFLNSKCNIASSYCIGYFIELAIFHCVAFTGIVAFLSFRTIVKYYNLVLSCILLITCIFIWGKRIYKRRAKHLHLKDYSLLEKILLIAFISLLCLQIIRGFTYDITYMSYDDATYTVFATDAIDTDTVSTILPYTGEYNGLEVQRAIQTSLLYPAYLSLMSGLSVMQVVNTVQHIQFIVLAYTVYIFMATELFAKRENQLLFLLYISVIYIYGYHSHYSLSFRLLGPNYQGKALLAVSLTPLITTLYVKKLNEKYDWRTGLLLLILSIASVSLTLWSIGTIIVLSTLIVTLSLFRRERQWKHLLYILWSCIVPIGFGVIYAFSWHLI